MRALLRIPGTPLKYRVVYALKFTGPDNSKLRPRFPGQIRWGSSEDIPNIVKSMNRFDKEEIFRRRIDNGDKCLVAITEEGSVAGYGWLTLGNRHIEDRTGCEFEFPESSIYAYDFFVKENHRLQGIWVGLMQLVLGSQYYNPEVGLRCLIAYGNCLSLRPHFRYGFEVYQRKTIITVLGKPFIFSRKFQNTDKNIQQILNEK
jgi:hypothetical protein